MLENDTVLEEVLVLKDEELEPDDFEDVTLELMLAFVEVEEPLDEVPVNVAEDMEVKAELFTELLDKDSVV